LRKKNGKRRTTNRTGTIRQNAHAQPKRKGNVCIGNPIDGSNANQGIVRGRKGTHVQNPGKTAETRLDKAKRRADYSVMGMAIGAGGHCLEILGNTSGAPEKTRIVKEFAGLNATQTVF